MTTWGVHVHWMPIKFTWNYLCIPHLLLFQLIFLYKNRWSLSPYQQPYMHVAKPFLRRAWRLWNKQTHKSLRTRDLRWSICAEMSAKTKSNLTHFTTEKWNMLRLGFYVQLAWGNNSRDNAAGNEERDKVSGHLSGFGSITLLSR
jgi:hypothetical protein